MNPDVFDLTIPARRAGRVTLPADMAASDAFRAITTECREHWRHNEEALLESRAVVHLHQMRVGIRRLRSSFSLFRPLWSQMVGATELAAELRSRALVFGAARDLDVLITGPLFAALTPTARESLTGARERAHDAAAEAVRAPQWADLSARLDEVLDGPLWSASGNQPCRAVAASALELRFRRVITRGAALQRLSDPQRHAIRIEAKKLRYGSEFFDSLYAADLPTVDTTHGPISEPKAFASTVEALQTVLGEANDHATASTYLTSVGATPPSIDRQGLDDRMAQAYDGVAALHPFWQ